MTATMPTADTAWQWQVRIFIPVARSAMIRIGLSGWTYKGWRGPFCSAGLAHRRELAFAAERYGAIEINGSFYGLQRPESFACWHEQTPPGFLCAVKGPRYITHRQRREGACASG